MIANVGFGALVLAFIISLYGIFAAIQSVRANSLAWVESARKSMLLTFPLISVTVVSIILMLVGRQYQYEYVYNVTSDSMPLYLKITALWGGQAGSLILWSWLLSAFSAAVTLRKWDRDRDFLPWVIIVSLVTLVFFLFLSVFIENPFTRFWQTATGEVAAFLQPPGASLITPYDGRGLSPMLRHPGMIIHPPMLYLGYVAFVIPFAFAIAALAAGRTDDRWIRVTRRWTVVAWLFLSLGLVLGMRWAYDVLGWGGYWGWDPVEVSSLLPWLSGTAFLHSVMMQEKRGLFKRWNMILIILTYSLVIFGTFLTRSGVLSSVHAFAQSAIGPLFFGFIGVTFLSSMAILFSRWNSLSSEGQMGSLLSREALFLYINLLFIGILAESFWGVILPVVSELFTGQKITIGPEVYERMTGPLFAGLLLLMGVCPLTAWGFSTIKTLGKSIWKPFAFSLVVVAVLFVTGTRQWTALLAFWLTAIAASSILYEYGRGVWARHKRTAESLPVALWNLAGKNRRRYGGYIIHLGVVLMSLGIIGIEMFQTETQGTIAPGGSLSLSGYTVTFDKLDLFDTPDGRNVARVTASVSQDGKFLGYLYPRRDYYYDTQESSKIPGVRSTMADDLYIVLADWESISSAGVTFKIYHNPLVNWLWLGGFVFILGAMVAAWPDKDREAVRLREKVRQVRAGALEI